MNVLILLLLSLLFLHSPPTTGSAILTPTTSPQQPNLLDYDPSAKTPGTHPRTNPHISGHNPTLHTLQKLRSGLVTIYNSVTSRLEGWYNALIFLFAVVQDERQSCANQDSPGTASSLVPTSLSSIEAIAALAHLPLEKIPTAALWLEPSVRIGARVEYDVERSVAEVLDGVRVVGVRGIEGMRGATSVLMDAWGTFIAKLKVAVMWTTMGAVLIGFGLFGRNRVFQFIVIFYVLISVYIHFRQI
ncbi:hypothetical protein BDR22DRAFT_239044 [Usnea florida]